MSELAAIEEGMTLATALARLATTAAEASKAAHDVKVVTEADRQLELRLLETSTLMMDTINAWVQLHPQPTPPLEMECPKCGGEMQLVTHMLGRNVGEKLPSPYYACTCGCETGVDGKEQGQQ